jgi:hypothetical protein
VIHCASSLAGDAEGYVGFTPTRAISSKLFPRQKFCSQAASLCQRDGWVGDRRDGKTTLRDQPDPFKGKVNLEKGADRTRLADPMGATFGAVEQILNGILANIDQTTTALLIKCTR